MNFAGTIAPAGLGAGARASDIIFAYVWQTVFFHERPSFGTMMGACIIGMSVVAVGVDRWRREIVSNRRVIGSSTTEPDMEDDTRVVLYMPKEVGFKALL